MPLRQFAWMIHCNDEGLENGRWQASVNWVMPWGADDGASWHASMAAASTVTGSCGETVATEVGDLLWPWKMHLKDWYVVHDHDGAPTLVQVPVLHASIAVDKLGVQHKIEQEIRHKTAHCPTPFSLDPACLHDPKWPDRSSLPHAFAPLTHLPAPVAQDILGLVTVVQFDKAVRSGCRALVPAFTVETRTGALYYKPEGVVLQDGIFTVPYAATTDTGVAVAGSFQFQIITEAMVCAPDDEALLSVECQLHGAEHGDIGARESLVARAFAPLELVSRSIDVIAKEAANLPASTIPHSAATLLLQIFGCGEIRQDSVARPAMDATVRHVMVWERLDGGGKEQRAQQLLDFIERVPMSAMRLQNLRQNIDNAHELSQQSRDALAPLANQIAAALPAAPFTSEAGRAMIAAAAALLASQDARQLWAAWLATLAVEFGGEPNAPGFWCKGGNFAAWQRKLYAVIDEHAAASLLANPQLLALAQLRAQYVARPDTLTEAAVEELAARFADLVSRMLTTPESPSLAAALNQQARVQMCNLRSGLNANDGNQAVQPFGDDRELTVALRINHGDGGHGKRQLRGYSIAIAAGYHRPQQEFDWQWLTSVALQVRDGRAWLSLENGGGPVAMPDTVGATRVNGRDVVTFNYAGLPLVGSLNALDEGELDPDGTDALDFYWPHGQEHERVPHSWPTPQLAYGLRYFTIAAPIGNAGRILDARHAAADDDRKLRALTEAMFDHKTASVYLCRVAPGAPVISLQDEEACRGYELADESRTRAYLNGLPALADGEQQRIALIRPSGGAWRAGRDNLALSIRAPDGTPNVVERWIQADWAQCVGAASSGVNPVTDPAVDGLDKDAILERQTIFRALLKPPTKAAQAARSRPRPGLKAEVELERRKAWPRHPAVRAFGIVVTLFNPDGSLQGTTQRLLAPACQAVHGYLAHGVVKIAAGAASTVGTGGGATLGLTLAPGCYARVDVCSLAPEEFFSGPPGLARMGDLPAVSAWLEKGHHYRGFAASTHWVECLPAPLSSAQRTALLMQLSASFGLRPDVNHVVAEIAGVTAIEADWLKGFVVQHHEWHWTGYPVAFPRPVSGLPSLLDWAEPFMGTESLRGSMVNTLATRVNASRHWHTGGAGQPQQLACVNLPSDRGAKYLAFVLRPVRRFDRWLERWTQFDNAILGKGLLLEAKLRWDDPALRLAPPDLKAAVPLVRTFAANGEHGGNGGVAITANGCLLCLRDVLYRTDEMARFGGVSETIEVQLEETRLSEVFEIGPNGAFHAAPRCDAEGLTLPYSRLFAKNGDVAAGDAVPDGQLDWRLVADRPFGLSNDLDRNAKVAQTALIVRVDGCDSANYWVMAKVKLRRLYDPDPGWTIPASVPADTQQPGAWSLGRRAEGDDWIPHDFCVELPDAKTLKTLQLVPGPMLVLPASTALRPSLRTRYLCSWHKGPWADNDQSLWGLQVQVQQLYADKQQWHTTLNFSPYETCDKNKPVDIKDPAPASLRLDAGVQLGKNIVSRLLVSDYSAPHWLTFIGMPFRHVALAGEAYWLTENGDSLKLMRANRASGNLDGRQQGEQVSRDLLLLPMSPADFGAGTPERRIEAESNSFHLLLLFKPIDDVTTAGIGMPLGQLARVYKPRRKAIDAGHPYPQLWFERLTAPSLDSTAMPGDCTAYIYRFHRPHDTGLTQFTSWEQLETAMFPTKDAFGMGQEATVRWTPEYVGPLGVYAADKWPDEIARPAAMAGQLIEIRLVAEQMTSDGKPDGKTSNSIELLIDPAIGWRFKARNDPGDIFPALVSGSCQAGDSLELMQAGGRLLARLEGWQTIAGPEKAAETLYAILFDEQGRRLQRTFTWSPLQ